MYVNSSLLFWFGGGEFEDPSCYNYVVGVSFVIIKK